MKNLYEVLEVSPSATQEELKKAYRILSKRFHPDMNPGSKEAEERFKEVSEAYGYLQDENKRREYDGMLAGRRRRPQEKERKKSSPAGAGFTSRKMNPIDVTDLFERYMGIKK